MTLADINKLSATIPDYNPLTDVTRKTKGDLTRRIMDDRFRIMAKLSNQPAERRQFLQAADVMRAGDMSALGGLPNDSFGQQVQKILKNSISQAEAAFPDFIIDIPNPTGGIAGTLLVSPSGGRSAVRMSPRVDGLFSGVKKFIKKVGDAFSKLFKKLVNWVFSGVGKAMGPFFIFSLLKGRNKVKSPAIKKRTQQQDKTFRFIQKIGKFDANQLRGLAMNGILEKTGKTPEQIAIEGGVPQIGAVALVPAIIKAITFVVKIVEKVASVFKKDKGQAGTIDQSTMSDPSLFEEEARLQREAAGSPGGQGGGGSGATPWLLAAGLVPLVLKVL
jgi:hypothetical protein